MFRDLRRRFRQADRTGRFAVFVLGATLASGLWLAIATVTTTSPGEAKAQRSSPDLPPASYVLQKSELSQIAWHPCERRDTTVRVNAPRPPQGMLPVVTDLAAGGTPVRTGTLVARVADSPIFTIVSKEPLYRDLSIGDRGPDVEGFETALAKSGVISAADDMLDRTTVEQWRRRIDPRGPADRIVISTLLTVPPRAVVGNVHATVGDRVTAGSSLMEVTGRSGEFRCDVADPSTTITPAVATLRADGSTVAIDSLVVQQRTADEPGHVDLTVDGPVDTDMIELGVESARSKGPVLAAPLSTIKTTSAGHQSVVVISGTRQREVPVTLGVSAQGLVEIEGPGLKPGLHLALFDESADAPRS